MAKWTTNKKGLPIKKWTADPKSRFVNLSLTRISYSVIFSTDIETSILPLLTVSLISDLIFSSANEYFFSFDFF